MDILKTRVEWLWCVPTVDQTRIAKTIFERKLESRKSEGSY
jgi:hypothetical protein